MSSPVAQGLSAVVVAEIAATGPMRFGRYVDLALYHPMLGFYADGGAGRRRDFITSAEVGPLFGAVVARALDAAWDELGRPDPFEVIEAGAGTGRLARAVLAAGPRCSAALRYVTVETSAAQRNEHPEAVDARTAMPASGGTGVVIANELCDNLAFDLYEYDGERWGEIVVDHVDGGLVERRATPIAVPDWIERLDPERLASSSDAGRCRVPDQYAARAWLEAALAQHERGRVIVIDYAIDGYPADGARRWLRTYRGHDIGGDPLDRPGTQDITVDVAIDQLASVRPPAGICTQAEWLRRHGIDDLVEEGRRIWHEKAAAPDVAALTARSRISEAEALCDPAGLGAFRVLEWHVGTIAP